MDSLFYASPLFHITKEGILGKRRDQEEIYCSFGPCDVREALEDPRVSKENLVEIARRLKDFSSIRFIELRRLTNNQSKGQIRGLSLPNDIDHSFDNVVPLKTPANSNKKKSSPIVSSGSASCLTPTLKGRQRANVVSPSPLHVSSSPYRTRSAARREREARLVSISSSPKCRKRLWESAENLPSESHNRRSSAGSQQVRRKRRRVSTISS